MRILPFVVAALSATLFSQEIPDPKHKQHEALKTLVGNWEFVIKTEAVPGVPGMEKASESKGTERAELVCNGLWLKSVVDYTWQGGPCQGIWLAGFDPYTKQYKSYWASSEEQEPGISFMDGTYDEKSRTWAWSGSTAHGPMRTAMVHKDSDTTVETCFMKDSDGKEIKCMEITRKRARSLPAAVEAGVKPVLKITKELELLHQDVGDWEVTIATAAAPGQQPTTDRGTERIKSTCSGCWTWSDFKAQYKNAPFEGHGLLGYDPTKKQYVSLWIDTMSPVAMKTVGTFDAAKKTYTFTGSGVDEAGKPTSVREVLTLKDADTRLLELEIKGGERTDKIEITYKRKAKG